MLAIYNDVLLPSVTKDNVNISLRENTILQTVRLIMPSVSECVTHTENGFVQILTEIIIGGNHESLYKQDKNLIMIILQLIEFLYIVLFLIL